jgi:hypothetical protein
MTHVQPGKTSEGAALFGFTEPLRTSINMQLICLEEEYEHSGIQA